jgi:L-malate glycosyltransferase
MARCRPRIGRHRGAPKRAIVASTPDRVGSVKILFANHTAAWSGAEVSLMRVIAGLRRDHRLAVACPGSGALADAVDSAAVEWFPIPNVDASLRLHPVGTAVGMGQLGAGAVALARAARRFGADVVHANTTRAGLMAALAERFGAPPFVVRAHEHLPLTGAGRAARAVLASRAQAVAAVSDYTARKFNEGLERPVAERVYNSVDHDRFDPDRVRPAGLRDELGLAPGTALVGQVAQITPWKGQDTAIRAVAEVRRGGLDVHLVLAGQVAFGGKRVRYDNQGFMRRLERLVAELAVGDAVHFLGQRWDVAELLSDLDLSLLPSWEEPFGLVTVESMALGTPPLVGEVGAGPELVQDRVCGRVLPPRRLEAWAAAIGELLQDRDLLRRVGAAGPPAAARFRDDVHAAEMLAVYRRAVLPPATRAAADERPEADALLDAGMGARWQA